MRTEALNGLPRVIAATLFPLFALVLQWMFWPAIRPYAWFLFYPAVFFSSWIGGLRAGIAATGFATALAWWFFIPPEHALAKNQPGSYLSAAVFVAMGVLFSLFNDRLRKANARAAKALEIARDANARLQAANKKITHLYEETLKLDELKTQFFSNISHELRTPLTLILGPVARRLAAANLSEEERRDLEVVDRNARFLYRHVTDLLDVAKIEAGRMRMHYSEVDLAGLVRRKASLFEALAKDRHLQYIVNTPDTVPAQIDPDKCLRILLNLLSNAFKFTPVGGVVAVSLNTEADHALIHVQDSGPGVAPDMREAIFEPFRQAEGGAARPHGGTGLGLSIVREFANLHGGSVKVTEAPGGGALFTVVLPLKAPEGTELRPAPPAVGEDLGLQAVEELRHSHARPAAQASTAGANAPLVLVVEDNPDMNQFVCEALGRHYRVASAFDGQDGLGKALAIHPDLIVSDVMMPGMSGDQMVHALRAHREMDDVPIIMLTAMADDALRVNLLKEGVQDYINKPFSTEELLARIGVRVTERQRMKDSLRESEARFEATFEQAAVGIALVAPDGRWLRVNRKLCEIVGYRQEELLSRTFQDITHPDDLDADLDQVRRMLAREIGTYSMEKRYIRKDGGIAWINLTVALTWKPDGEPDYFIAVVEDIQARKQADEVLREFSRVIEQTASTVIITDAQGVIEYVNPRFSESSGYSAEEAIGRRPSLLKSGHTSDEEYRQLWRTVTGGGVWHGEFHNRRKDGSLYWESAIISPVRDEHGQITHFAAIKDDITERKRAEAVLKESEANLKEAKRLAGLGNWKWDLRTDVHTWSEEIYRIYGRDPALPPAVYPEVQKYFTPESWANLAAVVDKGLAEGVPYECDAEVVRPDGTRRWITARGEATRDAAGHIVYLHGTVQDITERRAAEEALRASEAQLRLITDNLPPLIAYIDKEQRYRFNNRRFEEWFGRSKAEMKGKHLEEVLGPAAYRTIAPHVQRALAGELVRFEDEVDYGPPAGRRTIEVAYVPDRAEDGQVRGFIALINDIAERKAAERGLRVSEERANLAAMISGMGSFDLDLRSGELIWSDTHFRLLGYTPRPDGRATSDMWQSRIPPADLPRVLAAMEAAQREHSLFSVEHRIVRADTGESGWVRVLGRFFYEDGGSASRFIGVVFDDTERKHTEQALRERRTEMEQLLQLHVAGQTAAAIAHELNQPLNAIASYNEAALRMLQAGNPKPDKLIHALEASAQQTQRVGRAMRHLLEFMHKGETVTGTVDLNQEVHEALEIIEADGYGGFRPVLELAPELPKVQANRIQIQRVLVNLLRNGVEAMRGAGVPAALITVTVRTAASENMAQVTVRDSGPGLDPVAASRIFEPFFTTKPEGIGMGLAISRALIEAHGGKLWVDNEGGPGASFHFTLPFVQ